MSPTASLFALSLATTLPCVLVTVTHAADGRALETSGWQPLEAGVAWRASLVEEPARDKREGEPVGNVGVPRNDNPRKLVIEVMVEGAGTVSRREEIVVHSETVSGDPVSGSARVDVGGWPRPVLKGGRAVLLVEEANHVECDWRAAPKDLVKQRSG